MLFGHAFGHVGTNAGFVATERQVLAFEFTIQFAESLHNELLLFTALLELDRGGKVEAADGATSAASGSEKVLAVRVDLGSRDVIGVHVRHVLGIGSVAVMTRRDDWVEDLLEKFEAFPIASDETDGLDVRVTLVVDAGLQAVSQRVALGSLDGTAVRAALHVLLPESGLLLEKIGDEVVVPAEIGEFRGVVSESRATFADVSVLLDAVLASKLDPFRELGNAFGDVLAVAFGEGGHLVDVSERLVRKRRESGG